MFDENVPEQVIKEITGHSSDCVRVYKRTSSNILKSASECIGGSVGVNFGESKEKVGKESVKLSEELLSNEKTEQKGETHGAVIVGNKHLSGTQIVKNVIKTRMEFRRKVRKVFANKLARRIVRCEKKKVARKANKVVTGKRFVIDVNVNVNYKNPK